MGRFTTWWRQQKPGTKAAYWVGAGMVTATLAAAVIQAVLTSSLSDEDTPNESGDLPASTASTSTASATPTASPHPSLAPPPTSTPTSTPYQPGVYLADLDTLENAGYADSYQISGERYEQSVAHRCETDRYATVWATAGYDRLRATVGIADDDGDARGAIGRVTIADQDGIDLIEPFDVRLGEPVEIDIGLRGAVQIQVRCVGRDAVSGETRYSFYAVLGDAVLGRDS